MKSSEVNHPSAQAGQEPGEQAVWDRSRLANPHQVDDKAARVQSMFNCIACAYDLNNRLHSGWRDQAWRKKAVALAEPKPGDVVLDVACGTGDLTYAFSRVPGVREVIGVDFAQNMLAVAERKCASCDNVKLLAGDAMKLPLEDQSVDVVSIAFGIRNVTNPAAAVDEFVRVLRPGGRLVILEFSEPASPLFRMLYHVYSQKIMPITAGLIARDRAGAYRYLPRSVDTFMTRQQMVELLQSRGLQNVADHGLTFGIAVAYRGVKAAS